MRCQLHAFYMVICFSFVILGCSDGNKLAAVLNYELPNTWSLIEDRQITPAHRKVSIITPAGNFAQLELLEGEQAFSIDSSNYMTRVIESTFPTDELRKNTEFEFGDVKRAGQKGYFFNVTTAKNNVRFVLEFYQFATEDKNLFVLLTMDPHLPRNLQQEFDRFLASVSLGE